MKSKFLQIVVILGLLFSLVGTITPARADSPFTNPDADGDGLSNALETASWSIINYGPYKTNTAMADSDSDGLTDGEEKLFNVGPNDAHSPGLAIKYDKKYKTFQYFSATDSAYLPMIQGGDQYLMRTSMVMRRGIPFKFIAPSTASLVITGPNSTTINPVLDPINGGWTATFPLNGPVGTYTATTTEGTWSKTMPIYVIFELPADAQPDQLAAFLYDDDPANKKDEVAVTFANPEGRYTTTPCPDPANPNAPCSNQEYHKTTAYAQAFWTEQFKTSVFLVHTMKAINGITNPNNAADAIATWTDREFRVNYAYTANSFSSAMYTWNDGTGVTMNGGGCETTAAVFTSVLRSAGILARPFAVDYDKVGAHGGNPWLYNSPDQYDHSVMMWLDHQWKVERNYGGEEWKYYPYAGGVTGIFPLSSLLNSPNWYYSDLFGDTIETVSAGWDFQNGSNGGGTVNTAWVGHIPETEYVPLNRDYLYDDRTPLEVQQQSPYVEILNCQLWKGDNWAPNEWSGSSDPAGRNANQTYFLPAGMPNPANPIENWPYNPKPVSCSLATTTAACNAFKASWTTSCPALQGTYAATLTLQNAVGKQFIPFVNKFSSMSAKLGNVVADYGVDRNGDGLFDELIVKVEVTSSQAGEYTFGGYMKVGDTVLRGAANKVQLNAGKQTVEISFDGQKIGETLANGPYQINTLWVLPANEQSSQVVIPSKMLDYKSYTYSTTSYVPSQFAVNNATIVDAYSHSGTDENSNGLFDAINISIPLKVNIPGTFTLEADLFDGQSNLVSHATWTGTDSTAALKFNVANSQGPYTLGQVNLYASNNRLLDARYFKAYEITDMEGKIDQGNISLGDGGLSANLETVRPTAFSIAPVDTNANGKYDKLVLTTNVAVTNSVVAGGYKMEGVLEDENGKLVAWAISPFQVLKLDSDPTAQLPQSLKLEFDGKMLFDQLPLDNSAHSFKLISLKIYSGNLTSSTIETQVQIPALTIPTYARNQFEPSSATPNLFQDDLESGTAKWTADAAMWTLSNDNIGRSVSHSWIANSTTASTGNLAITAPIDLTNYAGAYLKFTHAYKLAAGESIKLQVLANGASTWADVWSVGGAAPVATTYWTTDLVDLTSYSKQPNVQFRFQANSLGTLLWRVDDVFMNAWWPAITSASFINTTPVVAKSNVTLTGDYTSLDKTQSVTYKWNFCGVLKQSTMPSYVYQFPNAGDCLVTLTVASANDSAVTSKTISVAASPSQYTLTLGASPVGGGSLTKSPDRPGYNSGDIVTVTQSPASGFAFSGWGGACTGTGACIVTMNSSKTVTANYTQGEYNLTIVSLTNGSIAKNPDKLTYHLGDVVTLTAAGANGWSFGNWTGDLSGTTNPTTITIAGNQSVGATFTQNDYTFMIVPSSNGTITKTPDQSVYHFGDVVQLRATGANGYKLSAWTGDLSGTTNPTSITITGNQSVGATFEQIQYTINIIPPSNGSITKTPDQLNYHYGDSVKLTALAASGYVLSGWSGDWSGTTNPDTISVSSNMTLSANFALIPPTCYQLTLGHTGQGSDPTANPGNSSGCLSGFFHQGEVIQLINATPNTGWQVSTWTGTDASDSSTLTMPAENRSAAVNYTQIEYSLSVTKSGNGTVDLDKQAPYHYGDVVQLTATPNSGWKFTGWSSDLTGAVSPISITMTGNKSVTATFTQEQYTLVVNVNGSGSVAKAPDSTNYLSGTSVTLTATPATGWHFVGWSGDLTGTASPITVGMDGNKTITATFVQDEYTLTVTKVGNGTVTITPEKTVYNYNDDVQLTATADQNWSFTGWSGGLSGTTNPISTKMTSNLSVTATFFQACSTADLIGAINAANIAGTSTTIHLDPGCTYQLTAAAVADPDGYGPVGLPVITGNITLIGNNTTISRTGTAPFRLFYVAANGNLTLDTVILSNGLAQGGNGGSSNGSGGGAGAGFGGAVFNRGTLALTNVTLTNNAAVGGNAGNDAINNGIYGGGGGGGMGGNGFDAISGDGALGGGVNGGLGGTSASTAGLAGGVGGGGGGGATTPDYAIGGNGGVGGYGGGGGGCSGNYGMSGGNGGFGGGGGAGAANAGGNGGVAGKAGFAGGDGGQWQGGGGGGMGGAIFNEGGTITITNSALKNNKAQGGNGGVDLPTPAIPFGNGGSGYGGAITNHNGTVTLTNVSYDQNTVVAGTTDHSTGAVDGQAVAPDFFDASDRPLTVTSAHGVVTKAPEQPMYPLGTTVVLTMGTVDAGWTFTGWNGGGCTGTAPCTVTITDAITVIANFSQNGSALTINQSVGGTISASPAGPYQYGDSVELTATANDGYQFMGWTDDLSGTMNPATIALNGDKTVGATFALKEYTVTVTALHGSVVLNPAGPYHLNDVVTLTATSDAGYAFVGWSGDVTGLENPSTVTITGNKNVTANFAVPCSVAKLVYDIRFANAHNGGTIALEAGCTYEVSTSAETDAQFAPNGVGLPVIRTDIVIIGNGATIKLANGVTFPLFVVTPDGSITFKNVKVGNSGMSGRTMLSSITYKGVMITNEGVTNLVLK